MADTIRTAVATDLGCRYGIIARHFGNNELLAIREKADFTATSIDANPYDKTGALGEEDRVVVDSLRRTSARATEASQLMVRSVAICDTCNGDPVSVNLGSMTCGAMISILEGAVPETAIKELNMNDVLNGIRPPVGLSASDVFDSGKGGL